MIYFYYLVAKDSPQSRAVVPWALLIAGIANILIAIWIIYYITSIYPREKVLVKKHEESSFDDDDEVYNDRH